MKNLKRTTRLLASRGYKNLILKLEEMKDRQADRNARKCQVLSSNVKCCKRLESQEAGELKKLMAKNDPPSLCQATARQAGQLKGRVMQIAANPF